MLKSKQDSLSVSSVLNGHLKGERMYSVVLKNENMAVTVTNLGGTITSICVPDRRGVPGNIVAGFNTPEAYAQNDYYLGCTVGRYANRIAGGRFMLDGKEIRLSVNDGLNHLHGGEEGFDKKVWEVSGLVRQDDRVGVLFDYLSKDGEEGYPGNLRLEVGYMLDDRNRLSIQYEAVTDKRTPVNPTNHSYFNLSGFDSGTIADHVLYIDAAHYTGKNGQNLPTGDILPLAGTPLDFSRPKRLGDDINKLPSDQGFDHNYVLTHRGAGKLMPAAELYDPVSGRLMRVFTDRPAIQLYTANLWDGSFRGQQGRPYIKHGAVALETQAFPDSPNHAAFPDTLLAPGDRFCSTTIYEFGVK
jgi:aldose 1-epimerase